MDLHAGSAAACCAWFYEQDWVQAILGESFHPGGTELSVRAWCAPCTCHPMCGCWMWPAAWVPRPGSWRDGLRSMRWGWISASRTWRKLAKPRPRIPPAQIEFIDGSAALLPCAEESFEAVVCECDVSTFPDQPCVLAEFARVLKPGGVVGLSDVVVEDALPDDIAGRIAPWTCLAAARSVVEYQSLFLAAGLCEWLRQLTHRGVR